jgi:hypothetical protein
MDSEQLKVIADLVKDKTPEQLQAMMELLQRAEQEKKAGQSAVGTDLNALAKAVGIEKLGVDWNGVVKGIGLDTPEGRASMNAQLDRWIAALESDDEEQRPKPLSSFPPMALYLRFMHKITMSGSRLPPMSRGERTTLVNLTLVALSVLILTHW